MSTHAPMPGPADNPHPTGGSEQAASAFRLQVARNNVAVLQLRSLGDRINEVLAEVSQRGFRWAQSPDYHAALTEAEVLQFQALRDEFQEAAQWLRIFLLDVGSQLNQATDDVEEWAIAARCRDDLRRCVRPLLTLGLRALEIQADVDRKLGRSGDTAQAEARALEHLCASIGAERIEHETLLPRSKPPSAEADIPKILVSLALFSAEVNCLSPARCVRGSPDDIAELIASMNHFLRATRARANGIAIAEKLAPRTGDAQATPLTGPSGDSPFLQQAPLEFSFTEDEELVIRCPIDSASYAYVDRLKGESLLRSLEQYWLARGLHVEPSLQWLGAEIRIILKFWPSSSWAQTGVEIGTLSVTPPPLIEVYDPFSDTTRADGTNLKLIFPRTLLSLTAAQARAFHDSLHLLRRLASLHPDFNRGLFGPVAATGMPPHTFTDGVALLRVQAWPPDLLYAQDAPEMSLELPQEHRDSSVYARLGNMPYISLDTLAFLGGKYSWRNLDRLRSILHSVAPGNIELSGLALGMIFDTDFMSNFLEAINRQLRVPLLGLPETRLRLDINLATSNAQRDSILMPTPYPLRLPLLVRLKTEDGDTVAKGIVCTEPMPGTHGGPLYPKFRELRWQLLSPQENRFRATSMARMLSALSLEKRKQAYALSDIAANSGYEFSPLIASSLAALPGVENLTRSAYADRLRAALLGLLQDPAVVFKTVGPSRFRLEEQKIGAPSLPQLSPEALEAN